MVHMRIGIIMEQQIIVMARLLSKHINPVGFIRHEHTSTPPHICQALFSLFLLEPGKKLKRDAPPQNGEA